MGKSSKNNYYTPQESVNEESDGYSDGEEEEQEDYREGGYHPVVIGDIYNNKYRVIKKLGWGQFSTVWLSEDIDQPDMYYALKIQKGAEKYREAAEDELELLDFTMETRDALNMDPPVLKLYDHFIYYGPNGKHICFVYELLGASLLDLIQYYNYEGVPLDYVKKIAYDMFEGLSFLHSQCKIIHTDLKPENILLTYPPPSIPELKPVPSPPPVEVTEVDPEIALLKKQLQDEEISAEEKNRLKNKMKNKLKRIHSRLRNTIPPIYNVVKIYRFITTNFDFKPVEKPITVLPHLTPCEYVYPFDEFYIKLYFLCPLEPMIKGLSTPHKQEGKELETAQWTYSFGETEYEESSNMFNIKGHGVDDYSRLHDIYDILTQTFDEENRQRNLFWSLRFDGRYCYKVFNILETLIPNLHFLHFPKPVDTLSAYEHTLLASVKKEFLPPNDTLFKNREGSYSAVYFNAENSSLYPFSLSERLKDWPTVSEIIESHAVHSDELKPFFPEDVPIHCKIVDLGNSCFHHHHYTHYIQTRQYRSPEAILCAHYSMSTDIWSAGCILYELVTGDYLFDPKDIDGVTKDAEHLALFEDLLGPININLFIHKEKGKEFFNRNGQLKYRHSSKQHYKLSTILIEEYHIETEEAQLLESLILPMLKYDPKQRATAEQCLKHPWFTHHNTDSNTESAVLISPV